jgi:hypothetical protein
MEVQAGNALGRLDALRRYLGITLLVSFGMESPLNTGHSRPAMAGGIHPVGGAFPMACGVDSRFRGNDCTWERLCLANHIFTPSSQCWVLPRSTEGSSRRGGAMNPWSLVCSQALRCARMPHILPGGGHIVPWSPCNTLISWAENNYSQTSQLYPLSHFYLIA